MKTKKSNFWIVLSNLIGYIGAGVGLLACAAVAGLKLAGYEVKVPVPWASGFPNNRIAIDWKHFLYAGVLIVAVILIAVIFRLIGNAVNKKRMKKALEEARKANSGGLLADMDPETKEMVVATAKKVVPIVAAVVVTCVVVKAVKKSQARKRMEEMRAPRYYYY